MTTTTVTSLSTYYHIYCPICKQRACESQNISYIHLYRCSKSKDNELLCNFVDCCHGCSCKLSGCCPNMMCLCDCHKDDNILLSNRPTEYKFKFNTGKDRYNKKYIHDSDIDIV